VSLGRGDHQDRLRHHDHGSLHAVWDAIRDDGSSSHLLVRHERTPLRLLIELLGAPEVVVDRTGAEKDSRLGAVRSKKDLW